MSIRRPTPGDLLVATVPDNGGYFAFSVVLILDSDATGALGVCLHRLSEYSLEDALPGWADLVCPPKAMFAGGPVSENGAICVARVADPDEDPPSWRRVFGSVGLLHLDTPIELVEGAFTDMRIFAGYAGWEPGQLEAEIARGSWWVVSARHEDIFGVDPQGLWARVLRRQGGELGQFSTWTDDPDAN